MGDADLLLQLVKAIQADADKPLLDQQFNPTDPVAVMLVMYEVDFAVDKYMEKWASWRDKFEDPSAYDNLVLEYQQKARKDVKRLISDAQQVIAEELEKEEDEEGEEN